MKKKRPSPSISIHVDPKTGQPLVSWTGPGVKKTVKKKPKLRVVKKEEPTKEE